MSSSLTNDSKMLYGELVAKSGAIRSTLRIIDLFIVDYETTANIKVLENEIEEIEQKFSKLNEERKQENTTEISETYIDLVDSLKKKTTAHSVQCRAISSIRTTLNEMLDLKNLSIAPQVSLKFSSYDANATTVEINSTIAKCKLPKISANVPVTVDVEKFATFLLRNNDFMHLGLFGHGAETKDNNKRVKQDEDDGEKVIVSLDKEAILEKVKEMNVEQ